MESDAPEGSPSLDTAHDAKTAAADAPSYAATGAGASLQSDQGGAQLDCGVSGGSAGAEVAPSAGIVTPHVRKVLASSDIFTPESGCESSPGVCVCVYVCARARGDVLSVCMCVWLVYARVSVCARALHCISVCSPLTHSHTCAHTHSHQHRQ